MVLFSEKSPLEFLDLPLFTLRLLLLLTTTTTTATTTTIFPVFSIYVYSVFSKIYLQNSPDRAVHIICVIP